jgi:hypothetical protein
MSRCSAALAIFIVSSGASRFDKSTKSSPRPQENTPGFKEVPRWTSERCPLRYSLVPRLRENA